jgi:hypothetical protein
MLTMIYSLWTEAIQTRLEAPVKLCNPQNPEAGLSQILGYKVAYLCMKLCMKLVC